MKVLRRIERLPDKRAGTHIHTALVLALVMLLAIVWVRRDLLTGARGSVAGTASLAIEPFRMSDSHPVAWDPVAFADSLATRLADVEGLSTSVVADSRTNADFTLSGDVGLNGGRLVVSTRLVHSGERAPVWAATFWRSRNSLQNFVDDVAAGVAEALYADIARRALTTARGRS